ncbi:carboxypeptidase-like regulatory domain-containing protein [Allomuricauda sp.]|uniref:carboxypeptidase-like regulatory domain-containing protein n=1 Tax=Flagellimonas alginolytica TaxID=3177515 RepID=UPI0025D84C24|nr:carboxypeptidase-like regulatory domain-containing protein [Allomuricauda sp.]
MKSLISLLTLLVVVPIFAQKQILGRITDGKIPLSNVHVTNLSSEFTTKSNKEGFYKISAIPKEKLQFTYLGMDTITIIIEDVTHNLNIVMHHRVEALDEVVVTKKLSKQKSLAMNYFTDSTIINTSFGYISPNTVPYNLKIIDGSELTTGTDVLWAIASRRAGIWMGTYGSPSTGVNRSLFMRGRSSINNQKPVLFEIDKNIFTTPPVWLDVSMIQRVGIIPGLQAVWRYGEIASGGVVIINTINGVHGLREDNSLQRYDQAKLRDNYVTEKVFLDTEIKNDLPAYLNEMNTAKSLNRALEVYEAYENHYSRIPYFYLDAFTYFYDKFESDRADEILIKNLDSFEKNPVWLKALAFTYESQSRLGKAHEVYKKIYALRPDYAQSFIDLANSYENLEKTQQALSIYARHAYLQDKGLISSDSLELSDIMEREISSLLRPDNHSSSDAGFTGRLVFEWNDSEAEFDLQFVNPNNQYFNWKHTLTEMPERIRSEKELGYSMADFLLDDEFPGTWKINATYHGNKQLTPTYLKVTMYQNYGSKLQTKEVKVFRLGVKGVNRQLFTFPVTSNIVQSK